MKKSGCTLVEMLVVIGIIAVLVGASIGGFSAMTKTAEKAKCQELVSNVATALTVAASLFLTVILAKAIGCTLPMLAKKIKLDPALMASPMITTLVDACSLMIMFGMASRFLPI